MRYVGYRGHGCDHKDRGVHAQDAETRVMPQFEQGDLVLGGTIMIGRLISLNSTNP